MPTLQFTRYSRIGCVAAFWQPDVLRDNAYLIFWNKHYASITAIRYFVFSRLC
jgi:hypothetical protein